MLDDVPFDKINAQVLERLKGNGVPEGRTVDYKRDDPTSGNRDSFLSNVTSFANTIGGYLLYGVETDKDTSAPTGFPGFPVASTDRLEQKLNSMIRDSVDPSMPPPEYQWLDVDAGRKVLVIRVRQSWAAPHAATRHGRYCQRNSNGKQPMDTHELRNAFLLAGRAEEQFHTFCAKRQAALLGGGTPLCALDPGAALVVHVAPLAVMGRPYALDIRSNSKRLDEFKPHRTLSFHEARGQPNIEGFSSGPTQTAARPRMRTARCFGLGQWSRSASPPIRSGCPQRPTMAPIF